MAKKEWDYTIVSAKDAMMARMSAIKATYELEGARIAAGGEATTKEELDAQVEALFLDILGAADSDRVGSSSGSGSSGNSMSAEDVEDQFNEDDDNDLGEFKLNFGKHAGKKISSVPKSYLEWVVENSNNTFAVNKVKEYLNA